MSIEPKFLLIPKDDYKILCDQSKGNPLIASVVMHINENCSGCPADIRAKHNAMLEEYGPVWHDAWLTRAGSYEYILERIRQSIL